MAADLPYPNPTPDECELLVRFLQLKRAAVLATADGLDDKQARWTPGNALLPIIGVINHLTQVERRWIDGRYRRAPFPVRSEEEFHPGAEVSLVEAVEAYRRRGEETDAVLRQAPDLGAPCLGTEGDKPPLHGLLDMAEPLDLRWIVLHLIEETAHHAGHADATRELLDGRRTT